MGVQRLTVSQPGDPDRTRLPYPIARSARLYEVALDPWLRYERVLDAAEKLIIWLGILALSWLADRRIVVDGTRDWSRGLVGSGISLGSWLNVVFSVEKAMASADEGLPGYADALRPQRKGAGVRGLLEAIVKERNERAHGSGPRTDAQVQDRLKTIREAYERAIGAMRFLTDLQPVIPQRTSYSRRHGNFSIVALMLTGEHPDFEPVSFESKEPLEEQQVYIRTPNRLFVLTPFCVPLDCPICRRRELFYPDRVLGPSFRLKSLDEGHVTEHRDLLDELPSWVIDNDSRTHPPSSPAEVARNEAAAVNATSTHVEHSLERRFHREMVRVYEDAKREANYPATRFLQMISENGGLRAAKQLLHAGGVSDGFTTLWERGRLDLSVEARVLKPEYAELFSDEEREIARKRLQDYGFSGEIGA